jgi:hypothetical protein
VTVDYRSVLADILQHRLATGNLAEVLPGYVDTPDKRLGPRGAARRRASESVDRRRCRVT